MTKFHLTNRAVSDLSDIADFTIQHFGIEQARLYRDGLNNCFEILAENLNTDEVLLIFHQI